MRRERGLLRVLCVLTLFLLSPAVHAERRVALVIGIDAYKNLPKLKKAVNDARATAAALHDLGFSVVIVGENLSRQEMSGKLAKLETAIQTGDTVFFFFSGHGVALGPENILLPADMPQPNPGQQGLVRREGYSVDYIIHSIRERGAKVTMLVLDACRDNPFGLSGDKSIGLDKGLAKVDAPTGVFVLFSAGIAQRALDRLHDADPEATSVFTRKFVPLLRTPGLSHVDLAKRVQEDVDKLAGTIGHLQQPAYYDQIVGRIVLKAGEERPPQKADEMTVLREQVEQLKKEMRAQKARPAEDVTALKQQLTALTDELARLRATGEAGAKEAAKLKTELDKTREDLKRREEAAKREQQAALAATKPEAKPPVESAAALDRQCPGGVYARVGTGERCLKPGDGFKDCPECLDMVVVPAGRFLMGSPDGEEGRESDEGPQRTVTISRPFAVGKFEVTVEQFEAFVTATGHKVGGQCWIWPGKAELKAGSFRNPGFSQTGRHPAVCVSWEDAKAYAAWLGKKTGKDYRLLTEAEWEYAARGLTTAAPQPRFHFGNDEADLCHYGNHADRSTKFTWKNTKCSDGVGESTAEVGRYKANAFGLYDMHGNVWEWVEDCYKDSYQGAPTDGSANATEGCKIRVLRGGSWGNSPRNLRSANRYWYTPVDRIDDAGFRLARTL